MQLKQLFETEDDRAVSPVIGVVLMLTATVIIGGVVASFVTGMGTGLESAPQASFDFDYADDGNLTITHEGGANIAADQVTIKEDGTVADNVSGLNGTLSTGSVIEVSNINNSSTVRVVWTDGDGGKTAPIAKWTGPDA